MIIDYKELETAFYEIGKGLKALSDAIMDVWNGIKTIVKNNPDLIEVYSKRKKQIENIRASWHLIRDNRKSSQVLVNKPRFLFRKVI